MHVVVTGGAGFIGSNVAAAYLRDGHRVTVFDVLRRRGTEWNLRWLTDEVDAGQGRLTFVRGDVRDAKLVASVAGAPDVDLVFHFAAQPAVTTSLVDPREDLDINLGGTFNVLEAVRGSRAKRQPSMFFTSTNKVYGSLDHRQVVETDARYRFSAPELDARGVDESEPLDFHSPYGCSKGAADQYVRDYARIYGLRTVVFRMSCIYGTRQFGNEDQGWLAHFLIAAATGQPLTIYGNGKQVRDILFVDDLVRAFQTAAERIDSTAGRVYNMGGGPANSLSIWRELRPMIEDLAGRSLRPSLGEWRPGDQPIYVSDTSAAGRDFGWSPRVGISEGLGLLWSWVQEHRELFTASPASMPLPVRPTLGRERKMETLVGKVA
ncbi:MAG: GDP-mannose 4,6-dehydratase [Chloroflexi bacterium]|nr:GDP-mannose 4,6-dehydratase [Chloroflexota bacterium]